MSALEPLLRKVAEDDVSGSSEIYSRLLRDLTAALKDKPTVVDWKEFCLGLSKVKRSMAPIQNVAGSIKVMLNASIPEDQINGFIKGFLISLQEKDANAAEIIAKKVANEQRPKKIVTLSYSGTVTKAILAMSRDIEVSVAESLPMGEGAVTCRKLSDRGVKVTLFRDTMICSELKDADLVLVGADGVCPEGVVNKVGTMSLAIAAKELGRPVISLCCTSKLIPVLDLDPITTMRDADGYTFREDVFELTPLSLFHSIITEEGTFSGEEMRKRLLNDRSKMKETECQGC
ncbi:MAG: hypothetical protein LUQ09_04095 [Methanomassiliicoccales archaeon]|nr:hypothetical protein [Methanomassiliicoccales archaeon]